MNRLLTFILASLAMLVLAGCPSTEKATTPPPAPASKTSLEQQGHHLYLTRSFDSAAVVLESVLKIDSADRPALADLAGLQYDLGMMEKDEKSPERKEHLTASRGYFAKLERLGEHDAAIYERLCELSVALGDDRGFLTYAKKSAEHYPYDRQYYNLGLAYDGIEDYQGVIRTEREAIDRFKQSPYLSSFYRLLGRAYMKVSRDQTAQRTLEAGVQVVDQRMARLKSGGPAAAEEQKRLKDDRIAMLLSLKKLHQTYHNDEKLKEVERQLKAAGYP